MSDIDIDSDDDERDERWWIEEYDSATDDPPDGRDDPDEPQIVDTEAE